MALGLGGLVQKATSIRSIVKKGLQAWYKSDTTQAPLGEEEIANGKFILGPELLTNGSFSSDSNWTKGTNWSISNGNATVTNSATSSIYQNILDATKSYEVTFEITSITSGGLRIGIGTNFSDYFTQPGIYTYYGSPAVDLLARINPSSGTNASIDNVSIKQTNHNNSWSTAVSSGATVSVKNGSVDIVTDGAAAELKQTGVFTVGKKSYLEPPDRRVCQND